MLRRTSTPTCSTHGTANIRVPQPSRPIAACTRRVVRVHAASTEPVQAVAAAQQPEVVAPQAPSMATESGGPITTAEIAELELAELDSAQEQLLAWMVNHNEEEHEEDLDEMVDYDEFGDEEYEEIANEVEDMIEASYVSVSVGDKIQGTVYEVDEDGAYVEIGEKASGFVPLAECSFAKLKTPLEVLRVGMRREFVVVSREDDAGQVVLSLAVLEASVMWHRMQQLLQEEVTVMVKVDSANRGGLLVKYGLFDGFVPVGQFGQQITVDNMESLVGQDLPVQFLEVNEDSERLVFSNKKASGAANSNAQSYKIGDVVLGVVQQIKPYGVFVDLGGMTGLLHISQVTNARIASVDKIFSEGDQIKVMVLSLDRERSRITLSTKKLEPTPGDMVKNPQLVYERADEMAQLFRDRMDQAQAQLGVGVDLNSQQPVSV